MNVEPFFNAVAGLIGKYFSVGKIHLLEKESRDIGGWVTIQWNGIGFRFTLDKIAYVLEVAAPSEPSVWYDAQSILLVMSGASYEPGQIQMLRRAEELGEICGRLMKNVDALASMLDATKLPETKRALAELKRRFLQSILDRAGRDS